MTARPTFVVCEDGSEYIDRFRRFLGDDIDFVAAQDFARARDQISGVAGLLLDLDFRRTPPERLVDERGPAPQPLDAGTRARLAETQGILILRQLRAVGVTCPAVLFADIDDPGQRRYLEQTLAPLTIAGSHLGLTEIAALLRVCALGR
ncbi:MAG TPA: hypothetical protein VFG23_02570 [Polyangia bacterium]|nr:hypothetical protein [Polyangia bacterium]